MRETMSAMTCEEVITVLLEYLDRTLDAEVVAQLEAHLEACEPCRAYLATYRRTVDTVRRAGRVEMPPELRRRLSAFLAERVRDST
jgi:anti-sigma factor (TIGR02949 family)